MAGRALGPDPSPWVTVRIPTELKLGPQGIADRCNWEIRPTAIPDEFEVAVRARLEGRPDQSVVARRAIGAAGAGLSGWERAFEWTGHDTHMQLGMRQALMAKAEALYAKRERVAAWAGFDLSILAASDSELPGFLQQMYPMLASRLPGSSLWALPVDSAFHSRRAATRAFLASAAAPELLERANLSGLDSGKGLGATEGMIVGPILEVGLLAGAPGALGVISARLPGLVALLFGQFEAGRDPSGDPVELIDLFKPQLLSTPHIGPLNFAKYPSEDHEAFFEWWVKQTNELLSLSVDPARFRSADGSYNPAAHYGFQLSFDRLVATVKGILVSARRDEYTRSILLFQALDLLKGLGLGDYVKLADPVVIRGQVEELKLSLPPPVQAFLIPRCEGAALALAAVEEGFFLTERIASGNLRVQSKSNQPISFSLHKAVAEYVNLVRDAGHTWAEKLSSPGPLSLFMAHNGQLPPELPDVAFLHLVRLISNPAEVAQRLAAHR